MNTCPFTSPSLPFISRCIYCSLILVILSVFAFTGHTWNNNTVYHLRSSHLKKKCACAIHCLMQADSWEMVCKCHFSCTHTISCDGAILCWCNLNFIATYMFYQTYMQSQNAHLVNSKMHCLHRSHHCLAVKSIQERTSLISSLVVGDVRIKWKRMHISMVSHVFLLHSWPWDCHFMYSCKVDNIEEVDPWVSKSNSCCDVQLGWEIVPWSTGDFQTCIGGWWLSRSQSWSAAVWKWSLCNAVTSCAWGQHPVGNCWIPPSLLTTLFLQGSAISTPDINHIVSPAGPSLSMWVGDGNQLDDPAFTSEMQDQQYEGALHDPILSMGWEEFGSFDSF